MDGQKMNGVINLLLIVVIYADLGISLECSSLHEDSFGNPHNDQVCYVIPDTTKRNWENAVSFCAELSAGDYTWSLLEIQDFQELDFLQKEIQNISSVQPWWVGQNDRAQEHVWKYLNTPSDCATTGVYLEWQGLQPNGLTGSQGDQDCIAFFVDDPGFQDKACTQRYYTLCETDATKSKFVFAESDGDVPASASDSASLADSSIMYKDCSTISEGAFSHPSDAGRCYRLSGNAGTYADAKTLCNKFGWDTVNIEDDEENTIIYKTFLDTNPDASGYWVAQNDQVSENVWTYSDQTNCNGVYVNFDQTKKLPSGESSKNCAVMTASGEGYWQDVSCTDTYNIMCKLRQQPICIVAGTTAAPMKDCGLMNCEQQWYHIKLDVSVTAASPRIDSMESATTETCAKECIRTSACTSFTFNQEESLCELYDIETEQGEFSASSGSNYYHAVC